MSNNSIEAKKAKYQLTQEQITVAIELATEGISIRKILDSICVNSYQFYEFKKTDPRFSNDFSAARLEGLEHLADDLLDIADDTSMDVQRARLKSDNSKWLLSKRKPEVYGERIDLNVKTTIDIAGALKAAQERIALRATESTEVLDITPNTNAVLEGGETSETSGDTVDSEALIDPERIFT